MGLAFFLKGKLVDTFSSLVNPQTYFDEFNIQLHGITPQKVKNAPKLADIYSLLKIKLSDEIVIHHTPFDRIAIMQISSKVQQQPIICEWLDSSRIARRAWEEVKYCGYGLIPLAKLLNINHLHPHDALDDAITAGNVVIAAIRKTGISFEQWVDNSRHNFKLFGSSSQELQKVFNAEPNQEGPLFGEVVVFTGSLAITRLDASMKAFRLGCDIDSGVTRKTTILVVGDQDQRQLGGYEKSSKHRKAEQLITSGQPIQIIGEEDFFSMINIM